MILTLVQAFGKDVHREHAGGWTRVFVMMALLFLVNSPPQSDKSSQLTSVVSSRFNQCLNSIGYAYASEVGDLAGTAVIVSSVSFSRTSRFQMLTPTLMCATDVRPLGRL